MDDHQHQRLKSVSWVSLIVSLFLFQMAIGTVARAGTTVPDTLAISLDGAEKKFLANNLQVLAARLNIEATKAATMQAGMWNNPNLSIEQNVYNKFTDRFFDVTKSGNSDVQIQQLIVLAGKRTKQVRLSEITTKMAEGTLFDLLRSLKFQLRTDFYEIYYLQKSLAFYNESITSVRRTVEASESMYEKRSILLSEVLRLKSLLFTLETERLEILTQIAERQTDLRVFFRDTSAVPLYYSPMLDHASTIQASIDSVSLQSAIANAFAHRPALLMTQANIEYEETNLELQKSLAIPDLTVGGHYSRAGSYIPDYLALTVSIDLPFFNRNQGNIQVSQRNLEMNTALHEQTKKTVEKEVATAYAKAVEIDKLFKNFDRKFAGEFTQLVDGMIANYQKRNISIIEFTDFFESYRSSMIQMNQLYSSRLDAFEQLNYAVGTDIIPL